MEAYENAQEQGIALPVAIENASVSQSNGATDNGPNALPQILHLSYKNRGEYHLDALKTLLQKREDDATPRSRETTTHIRQAASDALNDFSEALDKDEDDLNLWRRAAKVSSALDSKRIARYCLEAALEGDAESTDDILGFSNIEANVTSQELLKLENALQDDLALLQSTGSEARKTAASLFLKKQLDLYPFLMSTPSQQSEKYKGADAQATSYTLNLHDKTWKSIGAALLTRHHDEQTGALDREVARTCKLAMPAAQGHPLPQVSDDPMSVGTEDVGTTPEIHVPAVGNSNSVEVSGHQVQKSITMLEPDIPAADQVIVQQEPAQPDAAQTHEPLQSMTVLPSRKRSLEVTEPADGTEGARGRSKRIRARPSIMGEGDVTGPIGIELNIHTDKTIENCIQTDTWLFDTLDALAQRLDVDTFRDASKLRSLVAPDAAATDSSAAVMPLRNAIKCFYSTMQSWNDERTQLLMHEEILDGNTDHDRNTGLMSYLLQTVPQNSSDFNDAINEFVSPFTAAVNAKNLDVQEVAVEYILATFVHAELTEAPSDPVFKGKVYRATALSNDLQRTLEQLALDFDGVLYQKLCRSLEIQRADHPRLVRDASLRQIQATQWLFELNLDLFARNNQPGSEASEESRLEYRSRMDKWCFLSREAMALFSDESQVEDDMLLLFQLRHTWASVLQLRYSDDVSREHVIICLREIKEVFATAGNPTIQLPNNTTMPVLSEEAAASEISKLETMDFFLSIFQKNNDEPYDLVERLEPIMEQTIMHETKPVQEKGSILTQDASVTSPSGISEPKSLVHPVVPSSVKVLTSFLKNAQPSLRLSLWQRLQNAWETLKHPPKVFSICLRSIGLIITDMKHLHEDDTNMEDRQDSMLKSLRHLDHLLTKTTQIAQNSSDTFECMDYVHLQSSTRAIAEVVTLLYTVSLYDDYSQLGQKSPLLANPFRSYPSESFHQAAIKFHDMQIRAYTLLYQLFCEAMVREPESFPNSVEDRLAYLRHVHYTLGVRRLCKASDGFYLKFMMDELFSLPEVEKSNSDDFAQVLYDLYDLYCFSDPWAKFDHGCEPDYLDRKTALALVDVVLEKVKRIPIRELLRSDLGKTVERIHTAFGVTKPGLATSRNKKIFNTYMKSPINPLELFRSLKGVGQLSTVSVSPEESTIASKGWSFLKGQMSLARYKAQIRKGPGSTDDLQIAISFFAQDLDCNVDGWESWYCIAQSYDALFEEQVLWTAEKINSQRSELNQLQRSAIHAYTMAAAAAVRNAEVSRESVLKMSEMYAEFGRRIYASARQPFSMGAFSLEDYASKPAFGATRYDTTLRMRKPFRALSALEAIKFAGVLFRMSLAGRPNDWQ